MLASGSETTTCPILLRISIVPPGDAALKESTADLPFASEIVTWPLSLVMQMKHAICHLEAGSGLVLR